MNATQRQTEPLTVLEALEQRTLLSGDVMAGALVAEPLTPGGDLNNVAIIVGPSGDNTQTVGQSEQGPLAGPGQDDVSKFPFPEPGPIVDLLGVNHYMLVDHWGGEWLDTEKSDSNPDDDMMCWAAAASNILDWTGWGQVDNMTTSEQMFEYFQDHWTDEAGRMRYGWSWWFEGTYTGPWTLGWSQVDVPGGGFHPTPTVFDNYFQDQLINADAMSAVDTFLHAGYGTALGLGGGPFGHAVTVWGYTYNSSDPTDYKGIWITDSDDKVDGSPDDALTYYDVAYSNNNWYLQDYGNSNAWYIEVVDALGRNPNHRPDLYDAGEPYSWFGPDPVNSGSPWEAHFDIRNGSTADAGQFYVDFYASNNATITSGDHFLGQVSISGVAAGAKANADLVLTNLPLSLPTGSYYVGIIIDPTDNVDEFDEANNKGIDDSTLHVEMPALARLDNTVWTEYNPIPIPPRTDLPGAEYFPTFHDPASTLSLDSAAEPTSFDEYLPGTEDSNTLVPSDEPDILGIWDSTLRTDAQFYSDGGTDLTRTLDSSPQSLTLFDEDAGGDWNTSDLGVQNVFAGVSALGLFTFDLEL